MGGRPGDQGVKVAPELDIELPADVLRGRLGEISALRALWNRARTGRTRAVVIAGESGIGKSRLATELLTDAAGPESVIFVGRCADSDAVPYQPWVEILEHLRSTIGADALDGYAGDGAPLLQRFLRGSDRSSSALIDDRTSVFEAVADTLLRVADGRAILILLEDMHWSDEPSVALLRQLLDAWREVSCLIVMTTRTDDPSVEHDAQQRVDDLLLLPGVDRITLHGLDEAATGELIADWSGGEPTEEFVGLVHEQTDGSPFFCEEVLTTLDPRQVLAPEPHIDVPLPESVRNAIGVRLEILDADEQKVVTTGAVIGDAFDGRLIAEVTGLAEGQVLNALRRAADQRLVDKVPGSSREYSVRHALTRSAVLAAVPASDLAECHRLVAATIERTDPRSHGRIAEHLEEVGTPDALVDAARHRLAAARDAEDRLALEVADTQCLHGLADLDAIEDQATSLELDLLLTRARVLAALWRVEELLESAARAADVARELDDTDRFVEAVLLLTFVEHTTARDPRYEVLGREAVHRLRDRVCPERALLEARVALAGSIVDPEAARRHVEDAWSLLQELGDLGALIRITPVRWEANFGLVPRSQMRVIERAGVKAADRYRRANHTEHRDDLSARWWEAVGEFHDGHREQFAVAIARLSAAAVRRAKHPMMMTTAYAEATIALLDGDFEAALRIVDDVGRTVRWDPMTNAGIRLVYQGAADNYQGRWDRLLEQTEPYAQFPGLEGLRALLAACQAQLGQTRQAAAALDAMRDEGLERLVKRSWVSIRQSALAWLTDATMWVGDERAAPELLEMLEPYRGSLLCGYYYMTPLHVADVCCGELLVLMGRYEEAVESILDGMGIEQSLRARPLLVRTRYWLARALLGRDGHDADDRVQPLLDEATAEAAAMNMTAEVARLRELGRHVRR